MNAYLVDVYLTNPEIFKYLNIHGLELVEIAIEAQCIKSGLIKRDKNGHFYKDDGANCPHKNNGRAEPKENAESVKRKEEGVKAMKKILNGKEETTQMTTSKGVKVIFRKGNEAYGVEHMRLRRFNSGDVKTQAEFDKLIDGVVKALANAEPYKSRNYKNFDYKGYRAICRLNNDIYTFVSGYRINKKGVEDE